MLVRSAKGYYGDGRVRLFFMEGDGPKDAPLVVLLHGVHASASPDRENKYGYLGRMLARQGFAACVTESSRRLRGRTALKDEYGAWAHSSFSGKTFAMEVLDACSAVAAAHRAYPSRAVVLWGFSLGGLLSVFLAGRGAGLALPEGEDRAPVSIPIAGLVLSGCGDALRPEQEGSLALPILDTLWATEALYEAAGRAAPEFVLVFHGTLDETFSEESSRRLLNGVGIEVERKTFYRIPGASHRFRELNGRPSKGALREMIAVTTATLRKFL